MKRSIYKDVPHLLAADQAGFVWVYNEASGNIEDIFDVHASEITSMSMSPICEKGDARSCLLVTTSRDHRVKIFKMDEGYEEMADLGDHQTTVLSSHFLRDRDGAVRLVTVDTASKLLYWNLNRVRKRSSITLLSAPLVRHLPQKVLSAYMSPKALLLASDKAILCAPHGEKATACKTLSQFEQSKGFVATAVDPLGLYAIAASRKTKENYVVDLENGKVLLKFSSGVTTTSMRFSTDGNFLVSSDLNGALYVWRVADLKADEKRFKKKQLCVDVKPTQGAPVPRGEWNSVSPVGESSITPAGKAKAGGVKSSFGAQVKKTTASAAHAQNSKRLRDLKQKEEKPEKVSRKERGVWKMDSKEEEPTDFFSQQRMHAWADTMVGLPVGNDSEHLVYEPSPVGPSKSTTDPSMLILRSNSGEEEYGFGSSPKEIQMQSPEGGKVDEYDLASFIYGDAFEDEGRIEERKMSHGEEIYDFEARKAPRRSTVVPRRNTRIHHLLSKNVSTTSFGLGEKIADGAPS